MTSTKEEAVQDQSTGLVQAMKMEWYHNSTLIWGCEMKTSFLEQPNLNGEKKTATSIT